MNEPIISISGIRGIFGKTLTPENIVKYVSAFAENIKRKRVVIGRDGRLHGDIIEKIIESTLLFSGCEVINLGIVPTPTISLAVEALKAHGGISVTASHNPQQWNGMKFINRNGVFLDADENSELLALVNRQPRNYVKWNRVKQIEYYPDFINYHIKCVLALKYVNKHNIRRRKFRVAVDCVNSSGSVIIPAMLEKLHCKVFRVDCDSSGVFTRNPEPVPGNLKKICKAVKKNRADLGIVVDPDADRLVIITEEGLPYGEENTITTVINRIFKLLPKQNRVAVVNLSTSRSVDDVVNMHNGKLFRSPVGEVNVIKKMEEVKASVGGEGSGGVIIPGLHYSRDSLAGIALVLNEFADYDGEVSDYKNQLPEYHIKKGKIEFGEGFDSTKVFEYLNNKYASFSQNHDDGLRIDFESSWVNIRKSNTEPIIRVIAEAKTQNDASELFSKIIGTINEFK